MQKVPSHQHSSDQGQTRGRAVDTHCVCLPGTTLLFLWLQPDFSLGKYPISHLSPWGSRRLMQVSQLQRGKPKPGLTNQCALFCWPRCLLDGGACPNQKQPRLLVFCGTAGGTVFLPLCVGKLWTRLAWQIESWMRPAHMNSEVSTGAG